MPEYKGNLHEIAIVGTTVRQIAYRGEPVVTFAIVDRVHQRVDGTAGRTFRENRERFVEGEDFVEAPYDAFSSDVVRRTKGGNRKPIILLTRRGYLKLVKPMNDDRAWKVQGEMVDRYFMVEQARSGTLDFSDYRAAREHRLQFAQNLKMAALIGLKGAEAAIAANQATARATGFDTLEAMGQRHVIAPQKDALIVPSDIGKEVGLNAVEVNHLLQVHGFQEGKRTKKGKPYWVPTPKGEQHGGTMVVVQRAHDVTGSARQLKWPTSMITIVRELVAREVV
ncbi:hypothetical protein GCM10007989_04660 [Devosia pacifica]|uniref:KilA-N DNA-binding domain-containing protein n=1 Tax=Devosia pacifica TaxID=1335967 RepID=A0A918RY43_9HYPH|nr:ORF6N domain-containing protein [Devosia pacifica]GHA13148.1 hypothetical protein GCM10007989_04660 [Devosia pacifica]